MRRSKWTAWLRHIEAWFRPVRRPHRRPVRRVRPTLEFLEDRTAPAVFNVGTEAALRAAITAANTNTDATNDINLTANIVLTTPNVGGAQENANATGDLDIDNLSTLPAKVYNLNGNGFTLSVNFGTGNFDRVVHVIGHDVTVNFVNITITGGTAIDDGVAGRTIGQSDSLGGGILNGIGGSVSGGVLNFIDSLVTTNTARGANGANGMNGAGQVGGVGNPGQNGGDGRSAYGGGLFSLAGAVTLVNSEFSRNIARGGNGGNGGMGAGPFANGGAGGRGGNGGDASGGGIMIVYGGFLQVDQGSEISDNSATAGDGGAGGRGGNATGSGTGGRGGDGGSGGDASGGGISAQLSDVLVDNSSSVVSNFATAGDGGDGGDGGEAGNNGTGGRGGDGGSGGDASGGGLAAVTGDVQIENQSFVDNNLVIGGDGGLAGDGGHAGNHGTGGRGGDGGRAGEAGGGGIAAVRVSLAVRDSRVHLNLVLGGDGGDGGDGGEPPTGGRGGDGGQGGDGGHVRGGGIRAVFGSIEIDSSSVSFNLINLAGRGGDGGDGVFGGIAGNGGHGGNAGHAQGGGIYAEAVEDLTLINADINSNSAVPTTGAAGGAGGFGSSGVQVGGHGGHGGNGSNIQGVGLYLSGGSPTVTITNSSISNNLAGDAGDGGSGGWGGSGNQGGNGGMGGAGGSIQGVGIFIGTGSPTVTITNSTIADNTAGSAGEGGSGGAGSSDGGDGGDGGAGGSIQGVGIFIGTGNPTVTITGSTISGNTAENDAGAGGDGGSGSDGPGGDGGAGGHSQGGGLFVASGNVQIVNSTIHANSIQGGGAGGLRGDGSPDGANGAAGLSQGGGVFVAPGATVTIFNSTISSNVSRGPGGGVRNEGQLDLTSTIIGDNTSTDTNIEDLSHAGGFVGTPAFNLIESPNGHPIANGVNNNIVGFDPNLGPLQNNGGVTLTQLPNAGSPAINAGANPLLLLFDQRGLGFPRTLNGQTDIGATETGATPPPPVGGAIIVTGAGRGGGPHVRVFDANTQTLLFSFYAYDPSFRGGVTVAAGDVNNDGVPDIITGAGPGGGPHVKVFDGTNLNELFSFYAYDPSFRGGVFVGAGDVNNDGFADIITGAGRGGGPHVRVFSGLNLAELASFYAYVPTFRGGVTVAGGDINNDGFDDIITGAGPGGGPHVRVFSGLNLAELASFYAYDPSFRGGVFVGAGDVNNDGFADILTGAGLTGSPHVRAFSGQDLTVLHSFYAYVPTFLGGVRVAATDVNGDGHDDIVTGAGVRAQTHVRVFDGLSLAVLDNFFAYDPIFRIGVFVGGA